MTYLEIVNSVLRRLRENEVSSVNETPYSSMIAAMVNDVKSEIEKAWNWDVLRTTLTVNTIDNVKNYSVVGSGLTFRLLNVMNDTQDYKMQYRDTDWFDRVYLTQNTTNGSPIYYNFNGVDNNSDSKVDFYPTPDGVYSIKFKVVVPQADLVNNADVPLVDSQGIIFGTVARAVEERGDDGGLMAAEERYRSHMSDLIAIEAARRPDETTWVGV